MRTCLDQNKVEGPKLDFCKTQGTKNALNPYYYAMIRLELSRKIIIITVRSRCSLLVLVNGSFACWTIEYQYCYICYLPNLLLSFVLHSGGEASIPAGSPRGKSLGSGRALLRCGSEARGPRAVAMSFLIGCRIFDRRAEEGGGEPLMQD